MNKKQIRKAILKFSEENLISKIEIKKEVKIGKIKINFTKRGIKKAISKYHKFELEKNQALFNIVDLIKKSEYVKSADENKENHMVKQYHYFQVKIKNENSYIVIREIMDGFCYFYCIDDKCK